MDGTSNLSVTLNLPTPKYWRHLSSVNPFPAIWVSLCSVGYIVLCITHWRACFLFGNKQISDCTLIFFIDFLLDFKCFQDLDKTWKRWNWRHRIMKHNPSEIVYNSKKQQISAG